MMSDLYRVATMDWHYPDGRMVKHWALLVGRSPMDARSIFVKFFNLKATEALYIGVVRSDVKLPDGVLPVADWPHYLFKEPINLELGEAYDYHSRGSIS